MDQIATNICNAFGAGNIAPSTQALNYAGTAAISGTGGTFNALSPANMPMYPEGVLPTAGTTVMTFTYTSPGSYVAPAVAGGAWSYVNSGSAATNVYVTMYSTSTCGSSSVLMFRPKQYNIVGVTTPTCNPGKSYVQSQSAWAPYTLTYNVYASGAYPPVAAYTQSTNSWNVAFSTNNAITSSGVAPNTYTLQQNPSTQIQLFYGNQNDCMAGNVVSLGWAQYTNIANGNSAVSPSSNCIATTAATGGAPGKNVATLSMCSVPTTPGVSAAVNYVLIQKFETSTCTGSLGYHYIQLNTCHFTSQTPTAATPGNPSMVTSVMYTLQPTNGLATGAQNILQQYFMHPATSTTPMCTGNTVTSIGSSLYGTTGGVTVGTAATATSAGTPITAAVGPCMMAGTSYAQFSVTAQPTQVAGVSASYSTASYATTAACTSGYAAAQPTTIQTSNLVQLYVPSSTCNQVMWENAYQSTSASSGTAVAPTFGAGLLTYNNIFTLDSAPYGMSQNTATPFGQVANMGMPMTTPFYSQTFLVGCTNNQAMGANTQCFTVTSIMTGISATGAASSVFLQYLQGAVQNLLNPSTTSSTTTASVSTTVTLLSVVALSTTQTQITYNVQLPSMIYGTAVSATSSNNPFSVSATASATIQSYLNAATSYSNLVGGGNIYSSVAITSTIVTGSCTQPLPTASPTMMPLSGCK